MAGSSGLVLWEISKIMSLCPNCFFIARDSCPGCVSLCAIYTRFCALSDIWGKSDHTRSALKCSNWQIAMVATTLIDLGKSSVILLTQS